MNIEDLLIAARTVYGEARSEPYEGQKAVAHVLINRWRLKVGDADHSLASAALRWLQFSAWNENDPNRKILETVSWDNAALRLALRAVLEALVEPDFTLGARHYHTRAVSPSWSRGRQPDLVVGNHLFFRGIP